MAFATGTGNNQQDFLDAVRSFALGLGWTINLWDTVNKRLYLSKGICKVCLEWYNTNINTYATKTSPLVVVSEGRIRGSLVKTIGAGNSYWTFEGAGVTGTNGAFVFSGGMEGPYTGWTLFSNASGDYIHCAIQTGADTYNHIGFGIADNNGLTHAGAAYLFADGGRTHRRVQNAFNPTDPNSEFNDPSATASFFCGLGSRLNQACFMIYVDNALPAGFTNQVGVSSYYGNLAYVPTGQLALPLRNTGLSILRKPENFGGSTFTSSVGPRLLDHLVTLSAPSWSSYVPMMGVPLIVLNEARTMSVAVGSIKDLRLVNMQGFAPQQEVSLVSDTWKFFPQLRQTNWADVVQYEAPSSGQYGIAYKKIA